MRYRIIDIEFIKTCFKNESDANKAIEQLIYSPLVLSEEETLAKFKEVFMEGHDCFTSDDLEKEWDEFKNTL